MKQCSTCKIEKNESDFNFKDKLKGTLQPSCKSYTREQSKRYYKKNVQAHITRAKKSRQSKRAKFNELKRH